MNYLSSALGGTLNLEGRLFSLEVTFVKAFQDLVIAVLPLVSPVLCAAHFLNCDPSGA